ncbi:MAG: protein phosphatase 2C domain-containing protein [Bryobacteraceae bacterium]|jgi:serine/threonine protein phosphatase PrpC
MTGSNTILKFAGASDPGRVRHNNEDAWYIDAERGIFLVVDGIGGQAAGEKAAEIAVDRIRARLERQTGTVEQRVREAITVANNEILRTARDNPQWQGMACVLTLAVVDDGAVVVGHVGDSRLYEIRRGAIRKVTHDHSPVGGREESGELSEIEAMLHPRRNEVFRDVGSEVHAPDDADFIDIERIPFAAEAALLLCTDGLSDQVTSDYIRVVVERNAGDPAAAARQLIEAANAAAGKDNVTVVLVEGSRFAESTVDLPRLRFRVGGAVALAAGVLLVTLLVAGLLHSLQQSSLRSSKLVTSVAISPRVLRVDDSAGGSPASGIPLLQALAEARPGDVIQFAAGTEFDQPVRLKSGVTFRGSQTGEMANGARAILRLAPGAAGPAVLADNVRDVRIQGLRILADSQAPPPQGILLVDSSVEIEDTEIEGATIGIEVRGASRLILRASTIRDSLAEGLLASGPSSLWVSHNSFLHNHAANLAARDGAQPSLTGNVFDKSTLELPPELKMESVRAQNFLLDAKPATARPGARKP